MLQVQADRDIVLFLFKNKKYTSIIHTSEFFTPIL